MPAVAVTVPGRPDRVSDDYADATSEGDAVAVADGVGSASLGSLGSHTAVALILGEVRDAARGGALADALGALLARRYREVTGPDLEVATTCLFAICVDERVVVGQSGDGLAGVLVDDAWEALPSARGEWSDQTGALPHAPVACRTWARDRVGAVFLASDGVSDDLVPGREGELVSALLAIATSEGLPALEAQLRAWLTSWPTPGSRDDRSVALLIPGPP